MRQKVITFTNWGKECRIVLRAFGNSKTSMRLQLDKLNKEDRSDFQEFSVIITNKEAKKLRDYLDAWIDSE